jgi:uncharacterized phage protein (TIGR01671 family)
MVLHSKENGMREILFRAKRKDNGEWVEGLLWKKKYNTDKLFISCFPDKDDNEEVFVIEPSTVCQFTGLTDKNGTKIFEGDIHQYLNHFFIVRYGKYRDCETLEDVYGWYFEYTHVQDCEGFSGNEKEYVNIIGNIIDNKELLQ